MTAQKFMHRFRFAGLIILSAAGILLLVVLLMRGGIGSVEVKSGSEKWTIKQKELFDRLLKVPIILYHDIDGKGPFAVTSDMLRSHFDYFREQNIRVVPLSDLLERLDNPRPYDGRVVVVTFDDGYKSMYTRLLPIVKEYNYPITLFVYTDFVSENGSTAITWRQLREMQENGIDIQCHTRSHVDLVKLAKKEGTAAREMLYQELVMSRKRIEQKLGKPVDMLAFPFGYYDLDTIQLARFAGYRRVFSTDDGYNPLLYNNYCLRRHHVKRNYTLSAVARIIE